MDSPEYVKSTPSSGSILSNHVSRVFSAQVELSTSTCHRVLVSALLDSGANSCFMDKEFALSQKILLRNLPCPASVIVIDGRPIASGDIVEESEPIRVVLGSFACVISFNIISSPEHPVILGLPWFELHNPEIDWKNRAINDFPLKSESKCLVTTNRDSKPHQISPVSLRKLREEGQTNEMFVFAVMANPSSSSPGAGTPLPSKYLDFEDIFNKAKASSLPDHRPYDCPIDLQPGKEPPWGPIYNLSPSELKALREYIDEHLANGFIRHSKSPAGAAICAFRRRQSRDRLRPIAAASDLPADRSLPNRASPGGPEPPCRGYPSAAARGCRQRTAHPVTRRPGLRDSGGLPGQQ